MQKQGILQLPLEASLQISTSPSSSSSVVSGAAFDASKIFFDMLGCEADRFMVEKFMTTPDGKRLAASLCRMLAYINEQNISRLEKGLG